MDWENTFYSIVKETENNLAKAKEKLSGKSSTSVVDPSQMKMTSFQKLYQHNSGPAPFSAIPGLNRSTIHDTQILQMQEQINHQTKAIEKLQQLVMSLNNERDFYKEQISHLKGEIDGLTGRIGKQFATVSSERHMSAMKRELMHEIEKMKAMLQNFTEDATSAKKSSSSSSPHWSEDFWTVKENLTESLELIHQELKAVNKRMDKIEAQIQTSTFDRLRPDSPNKNIHSTGMFQRSPLYTAMYKDTDDLNSLNLQQLRLTVNSLNSKLDSLERRIEMSQSQEPLLHSQNWLSSPNKSIFSSDKSSAAMKGNDDDAASLSDISNISSISLNNTDDEIDALTFCLKDGTAVKPQNVGMTLKKKMSPLKPEKEFSFSDTDSDADLEADSLDFED